MLAGLLDFVHTPVLFHPHPVLLDFGPVALRWYSLSYIAGILFAWWHTMRFARVPGSPMTPRNVEDLISWATLGVIVGGRLAYVLFYDLDKFAEHPLDVFKLWEGGMSFHGGFIGVVVATLLYCHRQRLRALRVLDWVAVSAPMGLFLGRLANFNNGELWGRLTDGTWGLIFPGASRLPRHPSQLYEAGLEGLVLLTLLMWLAWRTNARNRPGLLGGVFVGGYGLVRFIVEFFREPDQQLIDFAVRTGLHMGQWLSVPMILFGAWLVVRALLRPAIDPLTLSLTKGGVHGPDASTGSA